MTASTVEILEAARIGKRTRVAELLEQDPALANARADAGESPLLLAIYGSAWDVVELLLSRGASYDVFTAAAMGNVVLLPAFLDQDPGCVGAFAPDGWTPLHLAAFYGHPDAARLLLERGADVHALSRNPTANQPLHAAAVRGFRDVVELLLAHGADPNARAGGGWTPLHLAAAAGHPAVIEALLARGADRNATDAEGLTALARAEQRKQERAAGLLRRS